MERHDRTPAYAAAKPRRMPPNVRKGWLALHVIGSVGWLGITATNLILAVTGLATTTAHTQHAVYEVMSLIADTALIPVAVIAYVTGIVVSVGTSWGLLRFWWVATKLVVTTIMVVATLLAQLPSIEVAATAVAEVRPDRLLIADDVGVDLVISASVSLTLLVVMTVLSSFKPWGRTRWGSRNGVRRTAATPPARPGRLRRAT